MGSLVPPDLVEPAAQVAGGAGEGVRDEALEAVEAVDQEPPLSVTLCQHVALVGHHHVQHFLQSVLGCGNSDNDK